MTIILSISDVISALNKRYQNRYMYDFEKKIDSLVNKIDMMSRIKNWIYYVENTIIEGYTSYKGEEYSKLLVDAEYFDEKKVYFIYKILLEIQDFTSSVNIHIALEDNRNLYITWKQKKYFDEILNLIEYLEYTDTEHYKRLDKLGKEIDYEKVLNIHDNAKSLSANLLGKSQYESFRPNPKSTISYNIKTIKKNQTKLILCPICGDVKQLYWNNKDDIFTASGNKVTFICDHLKSERDYDSKPVIIDLTEYKKKLKNLNTIDWVIFNYPTLFEKFLSKINVQYENDYVI